MRKIPLFGELVRRIKIVNRKKEMLSSTQSIPKKKLKKEMRLKPIIPIVVETKETRDDANKEKCIPVDAKARVGGPEESAKCKKHIKQFDEGTPQE